MTKTKSEAKRLGRKSVLDLLKEVSGNLRAFKANRGSNLYIFLGGRRPKSWPEWLRNLKDGTFLHVLDVTPRKGKRNIIVAVHGSKKLLRFPKGAISKLTRPGK